VGTYLTITESGHPPGAAVPLVVEPSCKRGDINLARKSRNHPRHGQEAEGAMVGELLADLDRRYPGMRFRMIDEQDAIRPHVRIFVNREQVWGLEAPLRPSDEVQILQALNGGAGDRQATATLHARR
jgi:sulfur-carrier protein